MRDILFHIDTYAEPTTTLAIDQAVGLAAILGCPIAGLATHVDIRVPDNWLAERLLHVSDLAAVEEGKSLDAAKESLAHLKASAAAAGIPSEEIIARAGMHHIGQSVALRARTRDLCLACLGGPMESSRAVAEELIFSSGRPVLLFHPERAPLPSKQLKRVAIAWDGSRCSARAVSDALPILQHAAEVRILTVVGEKPTSTAGLSADLVRHLAAYNVKAIVDEIESGGRPISASLDAYCLERAPDLLVMGGYGSPRLKEFVLGGATEHILNRGITATLLSH